MCKTLKNCHWVSQNSQSSSQRFLDWENIGKLKSFRSAPGIESGTTRKRVMCVTIEPPQTLLSL